MIVQVILVRFGSTSFFKKRFEFGSVRHDFSRDGSSSVQIDSNRLSSVRFRALVSANIFSLSKAMIDVSKSLVDSIITVTSCSV